MAHYPEHIDSIGTSAGTYLLEWHTDENADAPYDEGFTLITYGRSHNGWDSKIDITEGEADSHVGRAVIQALSNSYEQWDHVSGAALVRWLQLQGKRGVTVVDDEYDPVEASRDRSDRIYGIAWAPADATDPRSYTRSALAQWNAWASGAVFGWRLLDPSGEEIDSCWGYFDTPGEREYVLTDVTRRAQEDASDRTDRANLAGAGIVGII